MESSTNPTKFANRHQVSVNALRTPFIHAGFLVCSLLVYKSYEQQARKRFAMKVKNQESDQQIEAPLILRISNALAEAQLEYKTRMLDIRRKPSS